MRLYAYRALNESREAVSGRIHASDRANAAALIIQDKLQPTSIRPALFSRGLSGRHGTTKGSQRTDIQLIERISDLVKADMSVVDALSIIGRANGPTSQRASTILSTMRSGSDAFTAFSSLRSSIGDNGLAMIAIGESTGKLGDQLIALSNHVQQQRHLRRSIISQLIYPSLLFSLTIGTVFFLSFVILPEFGEIFDADAQPPAETAFVLAAGTVVRSYGVAALLIAFLLIVGTILLYPKVRDRLDPLLLRAPLLGPHWRSIEGFRFCRGLGALLAGGASLSDGLNIAIRSISTPILREKYSDIALQVRHGSSLSRAFSGCGTLPPEVVEIISMGENSGRLAGGLNRAAAVLDQRINSTLNNVTALLGPLLTAVMGLLIAGVIGAIMMGVMSINEITS